MKYIRAFVKVHQSKEKFIHKGAWVTPGVGQDLIFFIHLPFKNKNKIQMFSVKFKTIINRLIAIVRLYD